MANQVTQLAKVSKVSILDGTKPHEGKQRTLHADGTVLRVETREWKTGSFTRGFLPTLQSGGLANERGSGTLLHRRPVRIQGRVCKVGSRS